MFKRYGWIVFVIVGLCSVLWLVTYDPKEKYLAGEAGEPTIATGGNKITTSASAEAIKEDQIRQSERYAAQAIQKEARLKELRDAVRAQEDKVEERRKVLTTIVRSKGIIYRGPDALASIGHEEGSNVSEQKIRQPEEGVANINASPPTKLDLATEHAKRAQDAQDYVDAKRDFETDQKLLEEMRLKMIEERTKPGD